MNEQIRSADLLVTTALANPQILNDLKTKPEETLKDLSADVVQKLPRALLPPDDTTTNWIWLIVVMAFALVMVGAALILGLGVFEHVDPAPITKSDTILTVFTTVVGFLAGLLAPTPLGITNGNTHVRNNDLTTSKKGSP